MKFSLERDFAIPAVVLWETLMDVHAVADCLPGASDIVEDSEDSYTGKLRVKFGPVALSFAGNVRVTLRDADTYTGALTASARDGRAGGGFTCDLHMRLTPGAADVTTLTMDLESTVMGKIGEFGAPLVRRRIERMLDEFCTRLDAKLA